MADNILVLGIGNVLWADEGFGVRAVETLHNRYAVPDNVHVLDGGTQGLYLVPYVQDADKLIVFDAIDYGLEPGTMKLVRDDEVPKFTGAKKMSLHQTGFQDVLSAADLLGGGPKELLLIGVQAVNLDNWGGSLTDMMRAQIDPAIDVAVKQLTSWNAAPTLRTVPLGVGDQLLEGGIDLNGYEQGQDSPGARSENLSQISASG